MLFNDPAPPCFAVPGSLATESAATRMLSTAPPRVAILSLKRTGFPFFNPAAAGDVERPNAEHVLTIDIRVQVLTLVRQGLTGDDYLYTCRRYF